MSRVKASVEGVRTAPRSSTAKTRHQNVHYSRKETRCDAARGDDQHAKAGSPKPGRKKRPFTRENTDTSRYVVGDGYRSSVFPSTHREGEGNNNLRSLPLLKSSAKPASS